MKLKTFIFSVLTVLSFTISYGSNTKIEDQYFILTDTETGEKFEVFNIETKLYTIENSGKETSYALYINGTVIINEEAKCIGFTIHSNNPNLVGEHALPGNFFPCFNGWGDYVYQHIPNLEISEFGAVGEYIDISYSGYYRTSSSDTENKPCTGTLHVLRGL